jgi:hypothetical protein
MKSVAYHKEEAFGDDRLRGSMGFPVMALFKENKTALL